MPCSKRKRAVPKAPALELYDGPFQRIIRRQRPENLDIVFLSAKYGLISSDEVIANYDQVMTAETARRMASEVRDALRRALHENDYHTVFVNLGKTYQIALGESLDLLEARAVRQGSGRIGERLHQLKCWLAELCEGG